MAAQIGFRRGSASRWSLAPAQETQHAQWPQHRPSLSSRPPVPVPNWPNSNASPSSGAYTASRAPPRQRSLTLLSAHTPAALTVSASTKHSTISPPSASSSSIAGTADPQHQGTPAPTAADAAQPPPGKRLSVAEKLAQLATAQSHSHSAVQGAGISSFNPHDYVDARVHEAAVASQRRMSKKLSEANAYAEYMEQRLSTSNASLEEAADFLKKVTMEFGATHRLAEATAAGVRFGVDKEDAVAKALRLCERLTQMEKAVQQRRASFDSRVPKRVPVAWTGVASEVRLMGTFDNWTRGHTLNVSDVDTDGIYKTFEAQVFLLPGKHLVKFLVDEQWRLASDWPTEDNGQGDTNSVLIVA